MLHTLLRWMPVLLWAALIFGLSSMSTLPSAETFTGDYVLKKSAHMFVYAILFLLATRTLKEKTPLSLGLVFIACVLYGVSDEFHQSYVAGRTAKITDIGFDSIGISIAYLRTRGFI